MQKKGINYGHHLTSSKPYRQQVKSELSKIYSVGYRMIRVAMPPYDVSTPSIDMMKYIIETGLSMGFQVMAGVVSGGAPVTSSRQTAHLAYVTGTFATYVNSLSNNNLYVTIDNEIEEKVSGGLTISAAQDAILSAAATLQGSITNPINVVSAGANKTTWASKDISNLDQIGFNLYYGFDPGTGGFYGAVLDGISKFGSKFMVTEWSTANGYPDASGYTGGSQGELWGLNLLRRQEILNQYNLPQMVFTYADGSFSVTANTFALKNTDGHMRKAWYMLNKLREY